MIRRLLALCFGLVLAVSAGELAVRIADPPWRLQVVRGDRVALDTEHGAVTWVPRESAMRRNEGCEGRHLVVLGSSILYGSGLSASEVFSARIRGPCVHNLAAPGFDLGAKLASLAAWEEEHPVDVVWLEIWEADTAGYRLIGEDAWRLPRGTRVDDAGVPDAFGLPSNALWFRLSRLYAWATVSRVLVAPVSVEDAWEEGVAAAVAALSGREAALLVAPRLDRPFAESAADRERSWALAARRIAEGAEAELVDLAELLADRDHLVLRADPCCHFSAAGHAVLAEELGRLVGPTRDTVAP